MEKQGMEKISLASLKKSLDNIAGFSSEEKMSLLALLGPDDNSFVSYNTIINAFHN